MKNITLLYLCSLLLFTSCVTPKIHNALLYENERNRKNLQKTEKKALALGSELEEAEQQLIFLKERIEGLLNDSTQNGKSLELLRSRYNELSDTYDLLASKNTRYMSDKAKEIKSLLDQLEETQSLLFTKEDELNKLSNSLTNKEQQLTQSTLELEQRTQRVQELETIINKKDSMVTALKDRISRALIGLEGDGLLIIQKNGKVYISLEEDLLFASGKYQINKSGISALDKLSTVLATQDDLDILVEGHTDSIPLNGQGIIKDNWDLSVMRATSVVKELTKNTDLDPLQLTAAGRAEFMPIKDNRTQEGRSANRRIEMIVSPNLDDLFKLLND